MFDPTRMISAIGRLLQSSSAEQPEEPPVVADGRTKFEAFLLAEYDHISQAYFSTVASISSFFQYYVLIISLPVSAAVVLGKVDSWVQHRQMIRAAMADNCLAVAAASTVIFFALWSVAGYAINLRCDALLYARTINGIRKYFADQSGLSLADEFRFRVLPRSTAFPPYLEIGNFGFVVATFALMNSLLLGIGWWIYAKLNGLPNWWVCCVALEGILLHVETYLRIAHYREFSYLRGHIIGVDIDGVLARHREQFCKVLRDVRGKEISPDQIVQIPVHNCPDLCVAEEDEIAVFHSPGYWTGMPIDKEALSVLKRLKDVFHYKVFVFSWRDWPIWKRIPKQQRKGVREQWRNAERDMLIASGMSMGVITRLKWFWERFRFRTAIARITRNWLWLHGLDYDSLTIERGNVDMPYQWGKVYNRFVVAGRKRFRIFVEDEVNKACRLADVCDVVFLIKHPYNQQESGRVLPNNIVEVDSWTEILDFIKSSI